MVFIRDVWRRGWKERLVQKIHYLGVSSEQNVSVLVLVMKENPYLGSWLKFIKK